jgi:Holliday junction resolvasome RuvABC endonuclease subunit
VSTLGLDPGTRYLAWAIVRDGAPPETGCLRGMDIRSSRCPRGMPWPRVLAELVRGLEGMVHECQPDVIACEATQPNLSRDRTGAQAASQLVNTQRTEQLVGHARAIAATVGAQFVLVSPQASLQPLGLKRGATDRQTVEAFARLTGLKRLVRDHHEARAWGVAVRGEADARLAAAWERQGRLAI